MSIWAALAKLFQKAPQPVTKPDIQPDTTATDWTEILRVAGFQAPAVWAASIAPAAARYGITSKRNVAAFAVTIAHESANGIKLVESLNYTPLALMRTWPSRFSPGDAERMGRGAAAPADQFAIAERAYGGRMGNRKEGSGDGWAYRGRGLIQLTGKDAYSIAADATGLPLVAQPELAARPEHAALIAAWVWAEWKRCTPLADAEDVEGWRRAINGGINGLADVQARYRAAVRVG